MATEQISPRYIDLDSWSAAEIILAMYEGQLAAAAAVRGALGAIAAAVDDAVPALQRGGRIVYAGAGTSGRIGVQDGTELPPTFDWPSDRLVFAMAGGMDALIRSTEQAEDNEQAGAEAMSKASISADDVVIGIAASGTTPFTIGALRQAGAVGAVTIAVSNNPGAPLFEVARIHQDEGGHCAENRAQSVFNRGHGSNGSRLPRADGRHAGAECEIAPSRSDHGQRNRAVHHSRG
jgi:N-acetylmuramic acid 6-phosphate etherase